MPRPTSFQLSAFSPTEEVPLVAEEERERGGRFSSRTRAYSHARELSSVPFPSSRSCPIVSIFSFCVPPSRCERLSFVPGSIEAIPLLLRCSLFWPAAAIVGELIYYGPIISALPARDPFRAFPARVVMPEPRDDVLSSGTKRVSDFWGSFMRPYSRPEAGSDLYRSAERWLRLQNARYSGRDTGVHYATVSLIERRNW